MTEPHRRWLAFGLLSLALFVAAGCGGDDSSGGDTSATAWADDVCSAITTWTDSITSTAETLSSGDLSEGDLNDTVDDLQSATNDFVDDLKGLGRPDTDAGEQAKESLDELAGQIEDDVATMKSAVDDASGVSGVLQAVTAVSAALSTMGEQVSAAFNELESLDAQGELEDAFNDADACNELAS